MDSLEQWVPSVPIAFLAACCVVASIIDLKTRRLPNAISLVILIAGLSLAFHLDMLGGAIVAAIVAFVSLTAIALIFRRLRGFDGLGGGDIKLMAACASWLGISGIAPALSIASVSALLVVGTMTATGAPVDKGTRIPFGPFLSFGVLAVIGIRDTALGAWMGLS
ncbi:leader peptidase (prepilin peptidase)/N-methyltransferase [Kaistia hirudinis]|uniref:Leader peptidase (Prepilin peptidase)/N-methyltransferase n=1 Tax=Kaistia hirudinis TaxID=1293440 RepID=A0A840AKZ8_9HYPH|nr:A24 family peptidase [Kaistia hirudinis]MBB3930038.1 leader peptidase (prepilin peptidase)/N-methyltransferase [Kaistia hirudinis]